jgi:polyisoprenoid-binding protein YceI
MEGSVISGALQIEVAALMRGDAGEVFCGAEARIPVLSLKSGKENMDESMFAAMGGRTNKLIHFRLVSLIASNFTAQAELQALALGDLSIRSVTNRVAFPVTIQRKSSLARLRVAGSTPLKMSDFGITPPAPVFTLGQIQTGDEVTVSFDWNLEAER